MVAADDEDGEISLRQQAEKSVEQRHCLGGGDGLAVDLPGDNHRVDDTDDLGQDIRLSSVMETSLARLPGAGRTDG